MTLAVPIDSRGLNIHDLAKRLNERVEREQYLHPADFGVMSDDPADDVFDAVQGALNQAYLNHKAGWAGTTQAPPNKPAITTVWLPNAGGTTGWRVNKPLWVRGGCGIESSGLTEHFGPMPNLRFNHAGGYSIMVTNGLDEVAANLDAPITGAGTPSYYHAAKWSNLPRGYDVAMDSGRLQPNRAYFDFRDCRKLDLDGLAQFQVEMVFKADADTVADGFFILSMGRLRISETIEAQNGGAFRLQPFSDGIKAQITTSDGVFSTPGGGSGVISSHTAKNLCMSYDGAHLRTFIDGVMIDEVPATGTLRQHFAEGVFLGRAFSIMPYRSEVSPGMTGWYGTLKFKNNAVHTTGYSGGPSGIDSDTLLITDWTETWGPTVKCSTNDGLVWIFRHNGCAPQSAPGMNDFWQNEPLGFKLQGFEINDYIGAAPAKIGGLIFVNGGGTRFKIDNLQIRGTHRVAFHSGAEGNAYGSQITRCKIEAWNGRYAVLMSHNIGLNTIIDGIWVGGGTVQVASMGNIKLSNFFFEATGGDGWWLGTGGTPDRHDGGGGTMHMVVHHGFDIDDSLTMDNCVTSSEAGAYDVFSQILLVHAGYGPTSAILRGGTYQMFTTAYHAPFNTDLDRDPWTNETMPWFELDTEHHRQKYGPNYRGGVSLTLDEVGLMFWGAPRAVEELIRCVGDGEFMPCVIRNPRIFSVPPKLLCATPGVATCEIENGTVQVPAVVGDGIVLDDTQHVESAAGAQSVSGTITIPGGLEGGLLLIVARFFHNSTTVAFQGAQIGVAPFNVVAHPITMVSQLPYPGSLGERQQIIVGCQEHAAGDVVDWKINLTEPVGGSLKIIVDVLSFSGVAQKDQTDGYGYWASLVSAVHTSHGDTFETLRDDVMIVDFLTAKQGAVPVEDASATLVASGNVAAALIAYGVSTRLVATPTRDDLEWTGIVSSSDVSSHVALAFRPDVVTFDALRGKRFYLLLDRDVNLSHLVHLYDGMEVTIMIKQDGTGGWTFAWPSNVLNAPTVDATPDAYTIVRLTHDGTNIVAS